MGIDNPVHLIFIAAVALIVLGPKRLPELARSLGHGMREFRESMSEASKTTARLRRCRRVADGRADALALAPDRSHPPPARPDRGGRADPRRSAPDSRSIRRAR